jgi:lipopolysaccharide export system protein LptC
MSQTDDRGSRAYTASIGRGDTRRAFRAAMRHSRFVRLLRVALPAAVVLGVLAIILAATVLDPLRVLAKLPVNIDGLVVSGSKITTQGPRLAGFTQDRRPYVVTARSAARDATKPDMVELQELRATIEMKDAGAFEMTAQTGVFEIRADTLTLQDNILVNSTNYQLRLEEAVVNVRTSNMVSEKPVEVTMRQGTINANRLEVTNSGEVIRFERGVTMVLTPDGDSSRGKARTP